ncbi:putative Mdr [Vibrio alginolyticus 40B]|nr:putative Mdr [Vibrio alginolyticus 40B]
MIGGFVALLAISSLAFSTLLIVLFGNTEVVPEQSTGNFHWNLIGVVLAVATSLSLLNQIKTRPYMEEVLYVWKVKQLHNKIFRKLKNIKAAASNDNVKALTTLKFYYTTQRQVFELDNNTLTMSSVNKELEAIEQIEAAQSLDLDITSFKESWVDTY